LNDVLEMGGTK